MKQSAGQGIYRDVVVQRMREREAGWEDASDLIDLLKRVDSTVEFEPRVIPREWITQVLAAGRWSASSYNSQPWYFVVVADRGACRELQDALWTHIKKLRRGLFFRVMFNRFLRHPLVRENLRKTTMPGQVVPDHTIVIVSCLDPAIPHAKLSTSKALNNMALEAARLGMGCVTGNATRYLNFLKGWKESLGVPPGYQIFDCLMVGFAKRGGVSNHPVRKEVSQISHWV